MFLSLAAALLMLELPFCSCASTTSDLGILQLVTPTVHASEVDPTAINQLSADAYEFCSSYIDIDTFNFQVAFATAAADIHNGGYTLAAQGVVLQTIYAHATTSLLDNPTAYLSRLSASASPWPFSSQLMSQASGLLLGYKALVSQDVLNVTASQAVITPGVSISVGPAAGATGATGGRVVGANGATATAPSTSSSKAFGVPAATPNLQLVYSGAVAAAGIFGMILL